MIRNFTKVCLFSSLLASAASAGEVVAESEKIVVRIDGPVWSKSAEKSIQNGISGSGRAVSITELIPQSQSFDNWKELFAIMIEEDVSLSINQYTSQQIGRFTGACNLDPSEVFHFDTPDHYSLFVIPCGSYKAMPNQGEVAIFFVTKADGHLVKVYEHFRGHAFTAGDMSVWPATQSDIDRFLGALSGIQVTRK